MVAEKAKNQKARLYDQGSNPNPRIAKTPPYFGITDHCQV
jgi:hypothetical protein